MREYRRTSRAFQRLIRVMPDGTWRMDIAEELEFDDLRDEIARRRTAGDAVINRASKENLREKAMAESEEERRKRAERERIERERREREREEKERKRIVDTPPTEEPDKDEESDDMGPLVR